MSQLAVVFFVIYSSRSIISEFFIKIGAFRHFDDVTDLELQSPITSKI